MFVVWPGQCLSYAYTLRPSLEKLESLLEYLSATDLVNLPTNLHWTYHNLED